MPGRDCPNPRRTATRDKVPAVWSRPARRPAGLFHSHEARRGGYPRVTFTNGTALFFVGRISNPSAARTDWKSVLQAEHKAQGSGSGAGKRGDLTRTQRRK